MHAGSCHVDCAPPAAAPLPEVLSLAAPPPAVLPSAPEPPEPCTPAELRALVHGGVNDSDLCATVLARVSRIEAALDLEIGDGLAALSLGTRLISLGFSNVGDYAEAILDIEPRTAQAMARLSRGLATRPLLRAAVRAARAGDAEDDEWTRLRVRLSPDDRATVDTDTCPRVPPVGATGVAGRRAPGRRTVTTAPGEQVFGRRRRETRRRLQDALHERSTANPVHHRGSVCPT